MGELRKCMWHNRKCYFHMFYVSQWTIGESALVGGHSAGQMSEVMALIEIAEKTKMYDKGNVLSRTAHHIRFEDWSEDDR